MTKKEQQKIYGFRPDLELKYLFTHADRISVIHLLNTLFRTNISDDSIIDGNPQKILQWD